jgi:lysophospholipase L1-like esterase
MRHRLLVSVLFILSTSAALLAATPGPQYLALGDSLTFGFITQAGFEYINPDNFVAYPNYLGFATNLNPSNASCPGETTGSFLSSTAPDNGCHSFRAAAPLHVAYTSTQLDFATSFLRSHPATKLVTIILGANDVYLLQNACLGDVSCIEAGLPAVLGQVDVNLGTILSDIRATGFNGTIVVGNYYSLNYADPTLTGVIAALDQTIAAAAAQGGAVVADLFTLFQTASVSAGGNPCNAGLLNALPGNQFNCDDHASQSGHMLIAKTITQAFATARQNAP